MSPVVFITREPSEMEPLTSSLAKHGFEVISHSLIRTESIPFDPDIPETEWIFFSSSNAVRHFYAVKPEIENQKLAAIGDATAESLSEHGEVSFIGSSADTHRTAVAFAKLVNNSTVLFPMAEASQRTIQKALPPANVFDLPCYRTIEAPVNIGHADIILFSSPSNVRSFFRLNKVFPFQKIIAYGKTTARELAENGVENIIIPKALSADILRETIIRASAS